MCNPPENVGKAVLVFSHDGARMGEIHRARAAIVDQEETTELLDAIGWHSVLSSVIPDGSCEM